MSTKLPQSGLLSGEILRPNVLVSYGKLARDGELFGADFRESSSDLLAALKPRFFLACVLSALNLDPTEDHPPGFEFQFYQALIVDFQQINQELDLLSGVDDHYFRTLLAWQPRVDGTRTALAAWIRPGSVRGVSFRDSGAASRLGCVLDQFGYSAVILSGNEETREEISTLGSFALALKQASGVQTCLATRKPVQSDGPWDSRYLRIMGVNANSENHSGNGSSLKRK